MSSPADLFARAWQFHQAQAFPETEQLCRQILEATPTHVDAWCLLGVVCQVQGKAAEAESCFRRGLDLMPGHTSALNYLGISLAQRGCLDEAAASFERLLQLDPQDADAWNNLGLVRASQKRLEEAIAGYQEALRLRPDFPTARANLEGVLRQRGSLDAAPADAPSQTSVAPASASGALEEHRSRGHALRAQGNLEEALACYQEVRRRRPDSVDVLADLGSTFSEQGNWAQAAESYRQVLRLCPAFIVEALNGLAQASIWLGRLDEAAATYRAVLALRPDSAEAHHNLGTTLFAMGRPEEAAASYGQAVRYQPQYADTYTRDGTAFTLPAEAPATAVRPAQTRPQPCPVSGPSSRTILISANSFDVRVGGLVVLHKLCYLLRQKGLDARLWMFKGDTRTYFNTPIGNGAVDPRDCVVVYPELVTGNPLGGKHVVRWLLNTPGFFGVPFMHEPGDLLVSYTRHFSLRYPSCEELCVFEAWLDHFKPAPTAYRSGGCFTVRKGHHKRRIPETEGLLELQDYDLESLRQLFTTREVFYSYDAMSFLSVFAALCGCVSIVVPEPKLTRQEWRERFPLLRYGIAYGVEDRAWAEQTMSQVRPNLAELEEKSHQQVERLIERMADWL